MNRMILSCLLFIFFCSSVFAQESPHDAKAVISQTCEKLNDEWKHNRLSRKEFMTQMDTALLGFINRGILLPPEDLLPLLEPYRQALWSSNKYSELRGRYYYILMSNADILGLGGEAIFYAEKYDTQERESGSNPGLVVAYMKAAFLVQNENFKRAASVYEDNKDVFENYIDSAVNDPGGRILIHSIEFAREIVRAYIKDNQPDKAQVIVDKVNAVYRTFSAKYPEPGSYTSIYTMHYFLINAEINIADERFTEAHDFLKRSDSLLHVPNTDWGFYRDYFVSNTDHLYLEYYLAATDYEQAKVYLERINQAGSPYSGFQTKINKYKSSLHAIHNDYHRAYSFLDTAFENQAIDKVDLSDQVIRLSFAKAQSEFNAIELSAAQKSKIKLRNTIIIISLISLAIICFIYFLYRQLQKNERRRFQKLERLVDLEVENIKKQAKKTEQKIMARVLHDDYSNSLVTVKMKLGDMLENLGSSSKGNDNKIHNELVDIQTLVNGFYESVRAKSHAIYAEADTTTLHLLQTSIGQMVDIIASDTTARKEIDIDRNAIAGLSPDHQIEILRIIQECLSNLLKHGKKSKEIFVFLSKNQNTIELQVGNASGAKRHIGINRRGLGLTSIETRVKNLGGTLKVENEEGLIVDITIPEAILGG